MIQENQRKFQVGDRIRVGYLGDNNPHNYQIAKIFDLQDYRYYPDGNMDSKSIGTKTQAFLRFDDWKEITLNDLYSEGFGKVELVHSLESLLETLDEQYDIFVETFSMLELDLIDKLDNLSFEHIQELMELPEFEQSVYDFVQERLNDPEWREDIKSETVALYEQDLINDMDLSCGLYNMDTLYLEAIGEFALKHESQWQLSDSIYNSDEFDAYLWENQRIRREDIFK